MGATLTINGNRTFCDQHGLKGQVRYSCQKCNWDGRSPNCTQCNGGGYVFFDDYPFEAHLSMSSIMLINQAIGNPVSDISYDGEIDPVQVLSRRNQVYSWLDSMRAAFLLAMADEANRRGEMLVWS